jgi:HSP20 family protein
MLLVQGLAGSWQTYPAWEAENDYEDQEDDEGGPFVQTDAGAEQAETPTVGIPQALTPPESSAGWRRPGRSGSTSRHPGFSSLIGAIRQKMDIRDLAPWDREREVSAPRTREDPFSVLHRETNRIFEDYARSFDPAPWPAWQREGFRPRSDVCETDDAVLVTAEMPGLEEKDFEIGLPEGVLGPKGEKRHQHEEKGPVHRIEVTSG